MYRSVERARVKQQAGIGQYSGTNDLSENVFVVKQYVHAAGLKCEVVPEGQHLVAKNETIPNLHVHAWGYTIDQVRERAEYAIPFLLKPDEAV
jgi:hypothetical protein